ncbi:MAG: CBS domain-containing protein [Proteobacteria bacterium]|nr:CBS domain-containing protein [Pseudomonadota bacterium]
MTTLKTFLDSNEQSIITIGPEMTLRDAAAMFVECYVGALPVMVEDEVRGIFTERDLATHVARYKDLDSTIVGEVMSRDLIVAVDDDDITRAINVMVNGHVHHLPVFDENRKFVGIVSLRDLVQSAYAEDEEQIQYMNQYMYGPGM